MKLLKIKSISQFVFSFWSSLRKSTFKSYVIYYVESSHECQVKAPIRRVAVTKDFSFNSADYTWTICPSYLKAIIKDNISSFQLTLSWQSKIRVILSKLALLGSVTWFVFILRDWYKQNKKYVNVQTVFRAILFSVLMRMVCCITQQEKMLVKVLLRVIHLMTKRAL